MSKKEIFIKDVLSNSIAEEAGIESGDILLSINNEEINDIVEYRFLICEENLTIQIKKPDGDIWDIDIEKDYYDDIGITFDDPIIDTAKSCHNKCIFCFIDQLPKGMRNTLYFKDDDSRLSFLQGNFITLTNMSDDDIDRIIKYRISPINISIHTTNPKLRVKMLNNKNADNIMERLDKLTKADININCQIVLCKGINDGIELKRTLNDLFTFYPQISNVAIVPVGITKYRDNLYPLENYNFESSKELIKLVEPLQDAFIKAANAPFARLADEFYILANEPLPDVSHYEDFEQLEDGIGMLRYLEMCVLEDLKNINFDGSKKEIAFITGVSSFKFVKELASKIEKKLNLIIHMYKVTNQFFGDKITVTGLLTGNDIINQTKGIINEDILFIPSNMLKADEDVFLDDITLDGLKKSLNTNVVKFKYTGEDLVNTIINEVIKWQSQ